MKNKFSKSKTFRPPEVFKLISGIRNVKKRNLLRGYSTKLKINSHDVEIIRRGNTPHDSLIIGALLKGYGLKDEATNKKVQSKDLFNITSFPCLDWKSEVSYTAGYVNSRIDESVEMLALMKPLARLEGLESNHALDLLLNISKKFGASNYLSYKLAYLRSSRDLPATLLSVITNIEDEMGHRDSAGMHFSALENLSSKISLFLVAQRRISGLVGRVDGEFRKALSLSNFIPTPLDERDVAGFLLRATESSLIDTVYAILIIFNLSENFGAVVREFELRLKPELKNKILELIQFAQESNDGIIVTNYYRLQVSDSYPTLDLYRTSSAFLERPKFALYRNKLDQVMGVRFLEEIIGRKPYLVPKSTAKKELLLAEKNKPLETPLPLVLDTFYRTFLFLQFIGEQENILSLSKNEIKFIFENTLGLDALLTEDEMRTLYLTAAPEIRSLVAVLALALFRKKSIDPDIDFEFRTDFIAYVKQEHQGSIINFINYLLEDSPQVASYIVGSLDEVTLEKMYTLVKNASEAAQIRCEILRAVGKKLNRIEYFIQADAISTRSKLSPLQQYFDSSRMYVDSVAMKKWLDSNPTISTEQYRSLYQRFEASASSVEDIELFSLQVQEQERYLISQIVKDAFEQFCLNTEFGIESYLGRRIRHNTLDGVTTDRVYAVFRKREFEVVMANPNMRQTMEAWMASYKSIIDKLRRDHLQFKSSNSLFNSKLDLEDSVTQENIRKLTTALRTSAGSELLNDLVIAFCWKQVTPQLENAARFIKTKLLHEANESIEKYFSGYFGVIESQIKSELHEAVNEVLKKVADWFQVPQTGFISASIRDISQIIQIELNRSNNIDFSGNAIGVKYTGISVHRLYDCLAVLLKNAHKHSEENGKIFVHVYANKTAPKASIEYVSVDITSTVSESRYEQSKERILQAIDSEEAGIDMVTEGYTGIKKIKFITKAIEGKHTIRCSPDDERRELKLTFSIHAETSNDDSTAGTTE